jgi:hypothetical protein
MKIKARYDQIITKEIRNEEGDVIGHEPSTAHYVFGDIKSNISGGFYIRCDSEIPDSIEISADKKTAKIELPEIIFEIKIKDGGE